MDSAKPARGHPGREPGLHANGPQFTLQLVQVFFVGLTVGMMRVVIPALAEQEFGLRAGQFAMLASFVLAFGLVKAAMNLAAGILAERLGRRSVLLLGWVVAWPIPFMILWGPTWPWIIAATVLLGINQGLGWSATITAKLDLARADQRGLANGLNEFAGYVAVGLAGAVTAHLAERWGARHALAGFGLIAIGFATLLAVLFVRETRLPPQHQNAATHPGSHAPPRPPLIRHLPFIAICQAGLIEKFADALIWLLPPLLVARGFTLPQAGWIVGAYGTVWGASQLITGPLSDRTGRRGPITAGMGLCSVGVLLLLPAHTFAHAAGACALTGLGMALLYPNLGAAVGDIAQAHWRARALGFYRFWRDLGYALGAATLGLLIQVDTSYSTAIASVAAVMLASTLVVLALLPETLSLRTTLREP